jgi:hypothetical protein
MSYTLKVTGPYLSVVHKNGFATDQALPGASHSVKGIPLGAYGISAKMIAEAAEGMCRERAKIAKTNEAANRSDFLRRATRKYLQ